ncbi:unnamed protein product [Cuscuta epithymum]|uniref:Uncharacterized protein n=1 Tax=Cuscuta epithymum TaxID=186058 RepID=A0AAV0D932_9ASTE|nr:unnamed protein product [Cuscuta epithymum]
MEDAVSLLVSSPSTWISKKRNLDESHPENTIADVQSQFITKPLKVDGKNYNSGGGSGRISGLRVFNDPSLKVRLPGTTHHPLPVLMEEKNIAKYQRIVALSKMSLDFFEKNHPGEQYEFDSLKDVKSEPIHGLTYFIIFLAKNMGLNGRPSETFKARVNLLMKDIKVLECELIN